MKKKKKSNYLVEKYNRALVVEAGGEKKRRGVNIIKEKGYDSRDETTFGRINNR